VFVCVEGAVCIVGVHYLLLVYFPYFKSCDSSVSIVLGYGLDDCGSRV
jgi:hypothetical protein